jgi:putative DNA primase/helicase
MMLTSAIKYADRGLHVFPVTPGRKTPLTEHGCKDASSDLNQIREWWARWPEANIGLATGGKSNIVVVDYDVKKGKPGLKTYASFQRRFGIDTLTAQTPSGGIHQFFRYVPGLRNAVDRLPGVDIRTDGGYVLLAPSIVDRKPYKWIRIVSPAEMPAGFNCQPAETQSDIGAIAPAGVDIEPANSH